MVMSVVSTQWLPDGASEAPVVCALACESGVVDGRPEPLERARAGGLRVGMVYDRWPSRAQVRAARARGDVIAVPRHDEVTAGRGDEVRPEFVARLCGQLGVAPSACVVVAGRRALLAAAVWAGARAVMVPDDATPPFELRGQRLAPDLTAAVEAALAARRP
jgi:hypothetical protein